MSISVWLVIVFFISVEVTGKWDELKIAMEGDVLTLRTEDTELWRLSEATWQLERGDRTVRIAQMYQGPKLFYGERMIGRVKMDPKTGALTIWNISTGDSGLYKVNLYCAASIYERKFKVEVYAPVSVPAIVSSVNQAEGISLWQQKKEICSVFCSVRNDRDVFISWYKGGEMMNQTSNPDLSMKLSLPLQLHYNDSEIYSCTAENPVSNKSVRLHMNEICPQHEGCQDHCGFILIRLVLSGLVGIATVFFLVENLSSCSSRRRAAASV